METKKGFKVQLKHSNIPIFLIKFPIHNFFFLAVICFTLLVAPILAHALTTTASPGTGLYNSAQNVTLTADVPSVIFYTTDGTTPTKSSSRYSVTPISISATTTLKFFAVDTNDITESVKTAIYTMDTALPTGGIVINNGEDVVEQTRVTLTLTCSDTNVCVKMMVSNDENFTGATEENYTASRGWTLLSGDGTKTVYVKFKDGAGTGNWSQVYSDNINLDTTMPIGDPIEFLPKTGQTKCYNASGTEITCTGTGQDGELQAGVAWPDPRFANPDGTTPVNSNTVLDKLTGLEWTKDAGTQTVGSCTGGIMTWQAALDYVSCLNSQNYLGHNDWRLPNILELESLIDLAKYSPALSAGHPFINIKSSPYWSSTTRAVSTDYALHINIYSGYLGGDLKSAKYYVWLVRHREEAGAIQLFKTGQTISYAEKDDGDLTLGTSWFSPRFTDNNNGTVTDNHTGLIWLKNANCFGAKNLNDAIAAANGLENGNCGLSDSSNAGDWRLPNRKELLSLIDFSKYSPALSAGHPFINVQPTLNYQSSTIYASNTVQTWNVNMYGTAYYYNRSSNYYILPVRSGQSVSSGNMGISISRGAVTTKESSVNLLLSASHANGVAEMMISNDASFNNTVTVPYATTKSWTLSSGDGTKTVYVKFRATGNTTWSRIYSDSIVFDTMPPVTTANPIGQLCSSANVTLTANETGATIYYTTDSSTPTISSAVYSIPISVSSNTIIKFFAVDNAGNVEDIKTETYTIDTTLPAGTISINTGATVTNNATVTLNLSATDVTGVTEMKFRNENMIDASGNAVWSTPETYGTSKIWKLSDGEGSKTVYAKFKDAAGNWSISESYNITLDTTGPNAPVIPDTTPTSNTKPTWTWASGGNGGTGTYRYKLDNSDFTSGAIETTTAYFTPTSALTEGTHTLYVQERDSLGNWSASSSKAIQIDLAGPTGSNDFQVLPKTGQTISYAAGDDGALQRGLDYTSPIFTDNGNGTISDKFTGMTWNKNAWSSGASIPQGISAPSPRFTDNSNGTITDSLTGLIWLKNANCFGTMNWNNSLTSANNLKNGDCGLSDSSNAGDWRLPNIIELASLPTNYSSTPASWLNGQGFANVQSWLYCSSSARTYDTGDAWYVYMGSGNGICQ